MARKVRNQPIPGNLQLLEKTGIEPSNTDYRVALYIRLSKEDGGKNSPNTVENQRALLEEYVKGKPGWKVYDRYIDNGFSGTNFERPGFQRMMGDVQKGRVNCIIVKDLSRFGRSYIETGDYLEKTFPFFKVRFISVTDCYDTQTEDTQSNGLIIPLKNIINEVYAKDISKKVSSAIDMKKKEGRYGGGLAPYGYQKSKAEQGRYEVDSEAAEIVRYIFALRASGYTYGSIAKKLNEKAIKSPGAYRYAKGTIKNQQMKNTPWKADAIGEMLHDECYLGNMVRGKTRTALYKGEKRHHVPRAEWVVVKGTHEPIISKALFDAAQLKSSVRRMPYE